MPEHHPGILGQNASGDVGIERADDGGRLTIDELGTGDHRRKEILQPHNTKQLLWKLRLQRRVIPVEREAVHICHGVEELLYVLRLKPHTCSQFTTMPLIVADIAILWVEVDLRHVIIGEACHERFAESSAIISATRS